MITRLSSERPNALPCGFSTPITVNRCGPSRIRAPSGDSFGEQALDHLGADDRDSASRSRLRAPTGTGPAASLSVDVSRYSLVVPCTRTALIRSLRNDTSAAADASGATAARCDAP